MSLTEATASNPKAPIGFKSSSSTESEDRQSVISSLFKLHCGNANAVLESLLDELVAGKFKSPRSRLFRSKKYLDMLLFGLLPSPLVDVNNTVKRERVALDDNGGGQRSGKQGLEFRLHLLREITEEVTISPVNLDACAKVGVVRRVLNALKKANFGGPVVMTTHEDYLLQELVRLPRDDGRDVSTWTLIKELLNLVSIIAAYTIHQADMVSFLQTFRTDATERGKGKAVESTLEYETREKLLAAMTFALARACVRGPFEGPALVSLR